MVFLDENSRFADEFSFMNRREGKSIQKDKDKNLLHHHASFHQVSIQNSIKTFIDIRFHKINVILTAS